LGFASLLMDASELIRSLPVFMVSVLGASMLTGSDRGRRRGHGLIVKVFAGALSDWWGTKPLALMGRSSGALTKPMFAHTTCMGMVVAARMIDRVGKGIRGTPRDALVADIAPRRPAARPWAAPVPGHGGRFWGRCWPCC
jgi:MFS family permease